MRRTIILIPSLIFAALIFVINTVNCITYCLGSIPLARLGDWAYDRASKLIAWSKK